VRREKERKEKEHSHLSVHAEQGRNQGMIAFKFLLYQFLNI
jgi:hypothetical protein